MRRRLVITLLGVGLGFGGLVTSASADNSGASTWCTDGAAPGEARLLDAPISLSYETGSSGLMPSYLALCYSTTPSPSSDPEAAGGRLIAFNPLLYNGTGVECNADRGPQTVAAVDCFNFIGVADDPAHNGTSVYATFREGPTQVDVGRTGIEANDPIVDVNPPGTDGVTGAGLDLHVCAWATGPGLCPVPFTDAGVSVADGDLATAPGQPPCTGIDNTCLGFVVLVGRHPADTVTVTAADTTQRADVPPLPCIQVNATCPSP